MRLLLSHVMPGYSGKALKVPQDSLILITNIEGSQIGDLFALAVDDPTEYLDAAQTRTYVRRLFPSVGEQFWTNRHRPILHFVEDSSPGVHDMLLPPCDSQFFEEIGYPDHPNCRDNFFSATKEAGVDVTLVPQPVNLFQHTPVDDAGSIAVLRSPAAPGDYVTLRAEVDLILVLTACSVDVGEAGHANDAKSTELRVEVLAEEA